MSYTKDESFVNKPVFQSSLRVIPFLISIIPGWVPAAFDLPEPFLL